MIHKNNDGIARAWRLTHRSIVTAKFDHHGFGKETPGRVESHHPVAGDKKDTVPEMKCRIDTQTEPARGGSIAALGGLA